MGSARVPGLARLGAVAGGVAVGEEVSFVGSQQEQQAPGQAGEAVPRCRVKSGSQEQGTRNRKET